MTASRIQTRGHCQCCGRIQAAGGTIAKHGYEVKDRGDYGYFVGVCSGHNYAPMEASREQADAVVKAAHEDAIRTGVNIDSLKAGASHPAQVETNQLVRVNGKTVVERINWDDATDYQKERAVTSAIYHLESRARGATQFANQHEALVNRVHGQPLTEVKLEAPAAPIQAGEQRQGDIVLTAKYQDGAMVHYSYTRANGQTFKTKMASRSWRALPLAAVVAA